MSITIVGQISIGGMSISNISGDPRVSPGLTAASGSLSIDASTSRLYVKNDDITDINWSLIGLKTYSEATPSRVLNSAFQPDANNPVWVFYTVEISCTATLVSGQTGSIKLQCDSSATPTTVRAESLNTNSVSLAIALTAVNTQRTTLSYLVPPGHYVKLASTGTATMSLTSQSEVTISA